MAEWLALAEVAARPLAGRGFSVHPQGGLDHAGFRVQAAGGAQIDLARVLGVTQAAVSKWVTRGWVPLARAREIEALYGVPRTKVANPTMVDALTDASLV